MAHRWEPPTLLPLMARGRVKQACAMSGDAVRGSQKTQWMPLDGGSDSARKDLGGFREVMLQLCLEAVWRRQGRELQREGTACTQAGC